MSCFKSLKCVSILYAKIRFLNKRYTGVIIMFKCKWKPSIRLDFGISFQKSCWTRRNCFVPIHLLCNLVLLKFA